MFELTSRTSRSAKHILVFACVVAAALSFGCTGSGAQGGSPGLESPGPEKVAGIQQAATLACQMGPENTNSACSDGISNDGDPYIDCNDFNCCGAGLTMCTCCGTGCGPVYPDACSCPIACSTNSQCGPGQYCWAAGDWNPACRPTPSPAAARP